MCHLKGHLGCSWESSLCSLVSLEFSNFLMLVDIGLYALRVSSGRTRGLLASVATGNHRLVSNNHCSYACRLAYIEH